MSIPISQFSDKHYLTLPLGGDKFLISLSGVGKLDLTGQQGPDWHADVGNMQLSLIDALKATGRTPRQGYHLEFALEQWAPLATPNVFTDLQQAVNFGVAVDTFDVEFNQGRPRLELRVIMNIRARDIDTSLLGIGYILIVIGNVVEVADHPIP
jgi:hypothetical protein